MRFAEKAREWGFAPLRLIATIRRQDQWLASHYAQVSDRIPDASQTHFEAFIDEVLDPHRRFFNIGVVLDYSVLAEQLASAVGANNVLILMNFSVPTPTITTAAC